MDILRAEKLCISFGGLAAVNEVTFNVPKAKIVSLIGPNGAGKTTLFNLITGFYNCDSGKVIFCEKEINSISPEGRIGLGMARTFQNVRLFKQMTVLENVLVGYQQKFSYSVGDALFKTKRCKEQERKATEECTALLERINLINQKDNICSNLPYGQQKKLEIVRALASKPKLILLDEPAAGLNPQETGELSEFIRTLITDELTVLLIEHDMSMVMDISDYVYVLNHGTMLSHGIPEFVKNDSNVIDAYIGKGGIKRSAEN